MSDKVNVEKIMAEIRSDIAKKVYNDEVGHFLSPPVRLRADGTPVQGELENNLETLRRHYEVVTWHELKSSRPFGRLIVFLKRMIRSCIRFYIVPIVRDQNENNRLVTACLSDMHIMLLEMEKRIKTIEEENERLKGS